MTYELAKKLKDAGFPQTYLKSDPVMDFAYYDKTQKLHLLHTDNDTGWWIGNEYGEYADLNEEYVIANFTKCPTLSELIEACGNEFDSLTRDTEVNLTTGEEKTIWKAKPENAIPSNLGAISCFIGYTADEAVAHLWLALDEK